MRPKRTRIADLSSDVLERILFFVAKSSDGAATFARARSLCKLFEELANDSNILKTVEFSNVRLSEINGSFWQSNGLLIRCARAGNLTACNIHFKHDKDLIESIKLNVRVAKLASRIVRERIMAAERQACTRTMTRNIKIAQEVMEMSLFFADLDLGRAEKLLQAIQ